MNIYEELINHLEQNRNSVIVTNLKRKEGSIDQDFEKFLIIPTEETSDQTTFTKAKQAMSSGTPVVHIKENSSEITLFEPFVPKERLIVLGGGHIALPLVEFAAKTGFLITIADDRVSFANSARFPLADQVICESFAQILASIQLTSNDYIIIITRGHRHDADCLRQILKQKETRYVGMIGSRRRVGAVKELLEQEGYDKERLDRICTPIGLSIGAVTPEEIAVSILAQIIQRKRLGNSEQKPNKGSDIDYEVIKLLAKEENKPKCIVTVMSSKGSVPRGAGAKMIVYPTGAICGSIGGGCSEAAIIHDAVHLIGSGRFKIQTIDMTNDTAESEGMVCGGTMEVLLEDFGWEDL